MAVVPFVCAAVCGRLPVGPGGAGPGVGGEELGNLKDSELELEDLEKTMDSKSYGPFMTTIKSSICDHLLSYGAIAKSV